MPKRSPEHMKAQRERILRATIRCIGELGLEQTSIATIRSEAGLSTGAIYKHFGGKDEIVTAALQFAAMDQSEIPHEWSALRDDMAALEEERGFDVTTLARTNLELLASGLHSGPMRDLLKPQMEQTLALLAERLIAMEKGGEIRLKMDNSLDRVRRPLIWSILMEQSLALPIQYKPRSSNVTFRAKRPCRLRAD